MYYCNVDETTDPVTIYYNVDNIVCWWLYQQQSAFSSDVNSIIEFAQTYDAWIAFHGLCSGTKAMNHCSIETRLL